ncbi:MAG: polysaccharide biosynthesis tyrosine autokinase, partial [Planctomycetota bacterium]
YEVHRKEAERLTVVRNRRADLEKDLTYVETLMNETKDKMFEVDPKGQLDEFNRQDGFNFESLQDASDAERVWPILPIILAIGGLLGSLAGFGLGTLVDFADKTFHNPDEIMNNLNLPLIGHIPVIAQGKRYQLESSKIAPTICVFHRPKSQNAEAFRAVRTALYFNTQGQDHSIIQVTSPTPGDGKSTIASNLAVSIAQSGKKTLLIDADMRRPRQHLNFGVENPNEGMSTVLSGDSFWKDCVIQVPGVEGLFILPCGPKPSNPSELCTSSQLNVLFDQMKKEFDFIIIDSPPVLAVTDPSPIAARADGVILALRIRKNIRVSAQRATDILRNVGANIIGTVVNGVGSQPGYGSRYADVAYRAGYWYSKYGYGYG